MTRKDLMFLQVYAEMTGRKQSPLKETIEQVQNVIKGLELAGMTKDQFMNLCITIYDDTHNFLKGSQMWTLVVDSVNHDIEKKQIEERFRNYHK